MNFYCKIQIYQSVLLFEEERVGRIISYNMHIMYCHKIHTKKCITSQLHSCANVY